MTSGEVNWSFQTISETKKNLFTSSPVAFENTIIAPFSNGELVALFLILANPSGQKMSQKYQWSVTLI